MHLPEQARPADAMLTWLGAFVGIGATGIVYNIMNGSFEWGGQVHIPTCQKMMHTAQQSQHATPSAVLTHENSSSIEIF